MKKLFAANWKMNPRTLAEAKRVLAAVTVPARADVAVAPPYVYLPAAKDFFGAHKMRVALAAQDMFFAPEGAYTGAISAGMLKNFGVTYAILGHSERRRLFHETDADVSHKVRTAFQSRLTPILCVGEDRGMRAGGAKRAEVFVESELRAALTESRAFRTREVVVAYEPLWAIGAGKSASLSDARAMILFIKKILSREGWKQFRVLYGGSVDEKNISGFFGDDAIDGVLVGGASVKPLMVRKMLKKIV